MAARTAAPGAAQPVTASLDQAFPVHDMRLLAGPWDKAGLLVLRWSAACATSPAPRRSPLLPLAPDESSPSLPKLCLALDDPDWRDVEPRVDPAQTPPAFSGSQVAASHRPLRIPPVSAPSRLRVPLQTPVPPLAQPSIPIFHRTAVRRRLSFRKLLFPTANASAAGSPPPWKHVPLEPAPPRLGDVVVPLTKRRPLSPSLCLCGWQTAACGAPSPNSNPFAAVYPPPLLLLASAPHLPRARFELLDMPAAPKPETPPPPLTDRVIRVFTGRGLAAPAVSPRTPPSLAIALWKSQGQSVPSIPRLGLSVVRPRVASDAAAPSSAPQLQDLLLNKATGLRWLRAWPLGGPRRKWAAAMAVLILIGVYWTRSSPDASPAGGLASRGGTPATQSHLAGIRQIIARRAAIKFFDDFRGGLGAWQGAEGWSKTWKYAEAGFIEPGQLALYGPAAGLEDYAVEFMGQIERRSLNWVFRAADRNNYYAMKLVIVRGDPIPEATLTRYAVVAGREEKPVTMPVPVPLRPSTLFRVRLDVRGQDFTTSIQGQIVNTFTDARLKQGGVGFFSPKGDRSLLRWLEISHQYDFLGRLCGLIASPDIQLRAKSAE